MHNKSHKIYLKKILLSSFNISKCMKINFCKNNINGIKNFFEIKKVSFRADSVKELPPDEFEQQTTEELLAEAQEELKKINSQLNTSAMSSNNLNVKTLSEKQAELKKRIEYLEKKLSYEAHLLEHPKTAFMYNPDLSDKEIHMKILKPLIYMNTEI